jgi:hypothetical protein
MIEMPDQTALERIAQIASETDAPLSANQVAAVLAAFNHVLGGDPVGTMRRDQESGAVALRMNADGLHLWRINHPNGDYYNDLAPTLAWPVLHEPEA